MTAFEWLAAGAPGAKWVVLLAIIGGLTIGACASALAEAVVAVCAAIAARKGR